MKSIEAVHQKINEQFTANLESEQVEAATVAELLSLLSEGTCPKPEQLIEFYQSKLSKGSGVCSK